MPVMNHLGQQVEWRGSDGQRYAVYVMTASGLVTIDPGVVFSPAGGTLSSDYTTVSITCSVAATWTFTVSGYAGTASMPSGSSGPVITFNPPPQGKEDRVSTWSVTGTASGVTRTWTVILTTYGTVE